VHRSEGVQVRGRHESLDGRVFGNWTVVRRAENVGQRLRYLCRCACGAERLVQANNLQSGRTRGCGKSCREGAGRQATAQQLAVLTFIREHQREHQCSPTRADIAKHFGWSSPNAAEDHLRRLEAKGLVRIVSGRSRGIFVL
jgi:hypothetical protein